MSHPSLCTNSQSYQGSTLFSAQLANHITATTWGRPWSTFKHAHNDHTFVHWLMERWLWVSVATEWWIPLTKKPQCWKHHYYPVGVGQKSKSFYISIGEIMTVMKQKEMHSILIIFEVWSRFTRSKTIHPETTYNIYTQYSAYQEYLFIIWYEIFIHYQQLASHQKQMRMEQDWNLHDMIRCLMVMS